MEYPSKGLSRGFPINTRNKVININGEIITDPSKAKVSVFDRGFLFGDSIYEVTDAYEMNPCFLDEHLDRLWISASKLFMPINYTREEIVHEISKCLKKLSAPRSYIRIIITRGEGEITLDPSNAGKNNLIIICRPLQKNPNWWYQNGVEVVVAQTKRTAIESMDPSIKSGNYLNNILAFNEAVSKGAFDAIMLNHDGNVTEGTTSNVWLVKNGIFYTPALKAGLLSGITRAKLIELCHENNIQVREENISIKQLLEADEVFLTSSTKRIIPVVKIDTNIIGSGRPGIKSLELLNKYLTKFQLPR
ncbi:aminotransferase class IV [Bacteriovorax sp. Seq25_V]|uniref:aminotransferase class IV n=1 Tax=Bacteriovorax sp. Seq25_V TaxID=1201288 RepID=UPI00038A3E7B|nr:aminotransferase class IV [Bacteriovorax sp. Seq25_V]EQC46224.1 putative branched-chain-amino-acid transaminase [Bacteriovorax sp. Seq25_V]